MRTGCISVREDARGKNLLRIYTQQSSMIDCTSPRFQYLDIYEISIMIDFKSEEILLDRLTLQDECATFFINVGDHSHSDNVTSQTV
jgi:hypothetical protein